jgi:hypothetical protein
MRRSIKGSLAEILAGVVLCGVSFAQSAAPGQTNGATLPDPTPPAATEPVPAASEPANAVPRLAPGSVIPVRLTKTIDAKKAKSGDEVDARVTQDMKTTSGQVLVPKDTVVVGHITEAQPRSKEQQESQVGIAFDHAVMKSGGDLPVPMSIQAVIGTPALNPNAGNGDSTGGSAPPPTAMPSGGGAAPGSTSGRSPGMGAGTPSAAPNASTSTGQWPTATPSNSTTSANPPITASTQGVVGISNLKLSATANSPQGSVVSSDKSNVKLANGTFMLLRVN